MASVLVADDDPATRTLLEGLLHGVGHSVQTAADGDDAFAKAKMLRPDVLITDVSMPGLSGNQLTAAVRALDRKRYVFILVLTARGEREDRMKAMLSGADDFLVKPARADDLLDRIEVGLRLQKAESAARAAVKEPDEGCATFRALAEELEGIAEMVKAAKAAFARSDAVAAGGACDEAVAAAERAARMTRLRAGDAGKPKPKHAGG